MVAVRRQGLTVVLEAGRYEGDIPALGGGGGGTFGLT